MGKSNRQDTSSDRSDDNRIRGRMKKLEKENKQLRKELERLQNRFDEYKDIIEDEDMEEEKYIHPQQRKKNCSTCDSPLEFFTIESPKGPLKFEKCLHCKKRKRIK